MKDHEKINLRQLVIGYFLYSISFKIMALPGILANGSGNLAWLCALLGSGIEVFLVIMATVFLKHLAPGGKVYRILCFLFLPGVAVEVGLTSVQIYQMAYTDLATGLSIFIFILTLVFIGSFFITRKPRSFFRAGEIIWWVFALGLIIALIPPLYNLKATWPSLLEGDFTTILPTTFRNLLFFESAIFVFTFGSETKKTPRELRRLNLTALLCAVGYVLFVGLLVILFGPLLGQKTSAVVEITTASQFITNTGALDWLIAIAVLGALILRFGWQLVAFITLIKRGLKKNA